MAQQKKRKKTTYSYRRNPEHRKRILSWILLLILGVILFIFLSGNSSLIKLYSLHQKRNRLIEQKKALIKQNQQLSEEIEKLKNNDEYIEKMAREKYNMKKEKEEVYIINSK
ncbi:MAG: septum formation initiator family protein [Calditrichaeota bacterium]|nr:septum formation initiator family protein [Calditrichota bacterium]RQW03407.1 MAG: septum formation initiator family protein [Calditrichota bacterium]